ncbi:MAG: BREX-2 system phosphatase PglZ, partial [Pseudanabaena sp.]
LKESDLDDDILMRLAKRKLFSIDPWEVVKSLFQAKSIDPRLCKEQWIADYLIDANTSEGYTPVSNGFLNADTVWTILLERGLGIVDRYPDLPDLLKWSIDSNHIARLKNAAPIFQKAAIAYITELIGHVAQYILRCACQTERNDLVALGLVFGVLFHPTATGKLDKAIGKIEERYFQGEILTPNIGITWQAAAQEVINLRLPIDIQIKTNILNRADEILQEIGASHLAHLSEISPLGFNQRLESFAQTLSSILKNPLTGGLETQIKELIANRNQILQHNLVKDDRYRSRINNLDMAIRLLNWIHQQEVETNPVAQSLTAAIANEVSENSFADWARHALLSDEPLQLVANAYADLFNLAVKVRERQSKIFANLFASWTDLGSSHDEILVVENVLKDLVAPISSDAPVLLIVLDGMSVSVCHQLLESIARQGWTLLCKEDQDCPIMSALATVPSITEISRTSLLCGRLRSGNAKDESSEFKFHPDLNLISKQQKKQHPLLFHKAQLQGSEDVTLSQDVRQALSSRDRLVVGVVVNAIDDHLTKGEQLCVDWAQRSIKVIPALLEEAQSADRIVILASDHGHIIEHRTKLISATDGGERWRTDHEDLMDEECRLKGNRVIASGHKSIIAPWSEQIRYKPKKNGYHGGVNPQEIVIPIAVLSSGKAIPSGWTESSNKFPNWWNIVSPNWTINQ